MKTAAKQFLRILLLPLAVAVTAYFCSRTRDGESLLFYIVLSPHPNRAAPVRL